MIKREEFHQPSDIARVDQGTSPDLAPGLVETAVIYQGKGRILKGTR